MIQKRRVAITGIGPLASTGAGKDAFWEGIISKKLGLTLEEIHIDGELWDKFYFHKMADFDVSMCGVDKDIIEDIRIWKNGDEDKDLLYLLAAIGLALDDSNIAYDKEYNNIGLFLTSEHPGFEPFCESIIKEAIAFLENNKSSKHTIFRQVFERFSKKGYDLQGFMYLFFAAKAFGIHGYSLYTNNACASGLYALESAARQIRYGESDIAILAGGDVSNTMFKHLWFKEQGLYAEDGRIKPFSKNADGIVLGDGAAALVLEDMEHALDRNAHIYAEYLGGGFSLEGWKVTVPMMGSLSYQNAINSSLKQAAIGTEDIDLIVPHGVALKVTDGYEAKAMTDIFGKNCQRPLVTALKPFVGHNLGGSAIIESIILLLSMEKNTILPTLNCNEFEEKYQFNLVNELTTSPLNTAMKLSCGFAGYNAAAIFKKVV
ncbi:MAG: hypothetical protein HY808_00165 [Nitrospirae bacterium]|nr:hypothetical protein [Nitrospirota bacterium]